MNWVDSICKRTEGEIISVDGKTMCGAGYKGCKPATHIVSAWADENEIILGQIKVNEKSNEITAIPELLDALLIKGRVVTIDAMGCQKSISKKIIDKQADYVLAVKENQKELDLSLVFGKDKWKGLTSIIKIERVRELKATGKIETQTSHYISSLNQTRKIGLGIRKHWGIENKVHWFLDVAFNEDLSRKRTGNAAENYSTITRIALNLLKRQH